MRKSEPARPASAQVPLAAVGVLAVALVLRLVQLSSAVVSPLTYQLGPDEDYYFRFAHAVAQGLEQNSAEFTFMDPGYGYLLGALFKMLGPGVFTIFVLQCLVDTATAAAILLIGRELQRPRAGLWGALLYGCSSTALMFCCSLLKEVWVSAFMIWWVLIALRLLRSARLRGWFAFGIFCGIGISFRSTFVLMAGAALLVPLLSNPRPDLSQWAGRAALVLAGVILALIPWSARNLKSDGTLSPLPHNSGIVLHQAYSEANPASEFWIPPFVNYLHPSEIWRGYAAEASRRAGHPLSAHEVDAYWKSEALRYITSHPGTALEAIAAKALKFFASRDLPINRSIEEESLFSPVIAILPAPSPWLLAFGLVGLVMFARTDRRWWVLATPIAVAFVTVAIFWPEDRFRFHALPVLALTSGLWIDALLVALRQRLRANIVCASGGAALMLAASFAIGRTVTPTPLHWDRIVWGYIKMNRPADASAAAERVVSEQPDNGPVWEALGYLAVLRQDFPAAAAAYRRAIEIRPRSDLAHFNLAKVLQRLGQRPEAAVEARSAFALKPDPDYGRLLQELNNAP